MAAYWRLMRWSESQTYDQMAARARRDLLFSHLFERPARYRGQLIRLKLTISRATVHETEPNGNSLGIDKTYDLWGCTDDSRPFPYAVEVTKLPDDFPLGHDIHQNVTFVGYFLKLMAYKAHDDKSRAAPVLIGQVLWHPEVAPEMPFSMYWIWGAVLGGLAVAMLLVKLTSNMVPLPRRTMLPPLHEGEAGIPIETWLERAEMEELEPPPAINEVRDVEHPSNGNGHVFPERLDPTGDQER